MKDARRNYLPCHSVARRPLGVLKSFWYTNVLGITNVKKFPNNAEKHRRGTVPCFQNL